VGTPGNSQALSAVPPPVAERKLLQVLTASSEYNSLVFSTLSDELVTDPRVRKVVSALRKSSGGSEPIDFQRQIEHLTDEERSFLSEFALDESEPTAKGVDEILKKLKSDYLDREGAAIQREIAAGASGSELEALMRRKQEISRSKVDLGRPPRRKGNELGD
jgi:hypothetical protein